MLFDEGPMFNLEAEPGDLGGEAPGFDLDIMLTHSIRDVGRKLVPLQRWPRRGQVQPLFDLLTSLRRAVGCDADPFHAGYGVDETLQLHSSGRTLGGGRRQ